MKYIDSDKLIDEIERLNSLVSYESKDRHDDGLHDAYKAVENVIDSLQQEQDILVIIKKNWEAQEKFRKNKKFGVPLQQEQPDVDFEKAIKEEMPPMTDDEELGLCICDHWGNHRVTVKDIYEIARHFIEVGLNARKED